MKKLSGEELYDSIRFVDWALPKEDEEHSSKNCLPPRNTLPVESSG